MIGRVYQAINAVAGAVARDGVVKSRLNSRDNYMYRSIDDVVERLAPLLAQHKLCVLPRVLERHATERNEEGGALLLSVALRVAFDVVSAEDGSMHSIEVFGEALDSGDKATAKAMQSAYKYAVLQAFCVPAAYPEDADAISHRLKPNERPGEPPEGWCRWVEKLGSESAACESEDALKQLQDSNRLTLLALSRENPALYLDLGTKLAAARRQLEAAQAKPHKQATKHGTPASRPRTRRVRPNGSMTHD